MSRLVELAGYYTGLYEGHGLELIHVVDDGTEFRGFKVIGDANVPSGQDSFSVSYRLSTSPGGNVSRVIEQVRGQVATRHFRNASWIPGSLTIVSADEFQIEWVGLGAISFRRVPELSLVASTRTDLPET